MTFETFWAAVIEAIEVRTGEDLSRSDKLFVVPFEVLRELLRQVYELGVRIGKGEE